MKIHAEIRDELQALNSQLADNQRVNPYAVRRDYFENLTAVILERIGVSQSYQLTVLSGISRSAPYIVPTGYFEDLPARMLQIIKQGEQPSIDEIKLLSPLLSGLKNKPTYSVPDGYFEENKTPAKAAPVVKMDTRKIFRYAAAAVITTLLVLSGFLFLNQGKVDPTENSYAWVEKSIKKVSTDNIDEFIDLVNVGSPADSASLSAIAGQINVLIRDVPEAEIESLLNDTEILDEDSADELFLN